jgi:hypothetical protein
MSGLGKGRINQAGGGRSRPCTERQRSAHRVSLVVGSAGARQRGKRGRSCCATTRAVACIDVLEVLAAPAARGDPVRPVAAGRVGAGCQGDRCHLAHRLGCHGRLGHAATVGHPACPRLSRRCPPRRSTVSNSRYESLSPCPGPVAGVMCRSSTSGSKDEVLEIGTFMRWGGPVEALPDAGRLDEPRGGGGRVALG